MAGVGAGCGVCVCTDGLAAVVDRGSSLRCMHCATTMTSKAAIIQEPSDDFAFRFAMKSPASNWRDYAKESRGL